MKAGYEHSFRVTPCEMDGITFYHVGDTLLDPSFWKALGKALNWEDKPNDRSTFWTKQKEENVVTLLDEWENQMHNFVDHLIIEQTPESFFDPF